MTDDKAAFSLDAALDSAYDTMTSTTEEVTQEVDTPIAEGEKPEAEVTVQSGTEEKLEAEKPIEAPVSWTAEAKEKFSKLPPDLQTYVAQRESEREKLLGQKSTEYSEQQRKYDALEQVLAPRRQALAMQYGGEAQGIDQLLQLNEFASSNPAGFLQWFAQQRGIDLGQLNPVTATDEYVDPVTKQLQQELQGIKQTLTTQQQAQAAARQETIRNEILAFKDEKDESGTVLRPHFEEVKQQMASLMQGGAAKTLKHAYEMAVWANPAVRERILADKQKAEEAKRLDAAKQAASKAEKAKGVTVKSKKAGEAAPSKRGTWEDTLNDAAEELYGAA